VVQYGGTEFPVVVTVLESEMLRGEEGEEPEKGEPACTIEIGYAEGLSRLALALGLLDHLAPKQQRAALGG